ncbi:MAG: hypothetical protein ACRD1K_20765 [Acidimicrobiales bacterium]
MTEVTVRDDDISERARSIARTLDRLPPGEYIVHLSWPHPKSDQEFHTEILRRDLTGRSQGATTADVN